MTLRAQAVAAMYDRSGILPQQNFVRCDHSRSSGRNAQGVSLPITGTGECSHDGLLGHETYFSDGEDGRVHQGVLPQNYSHCIKLTYGLALNQGRI